MKRALHILGSFSTAFLLLFGLACNRETSKTLTEPDVAIEWAKMALYVTKNTPSNSPTFASRGFAYIGLTMYEAIVNGYDTHRSMAGQLNELEELPMPDSSLSLNWTLCLNAAQLPFLKIFISRLRMKTNQE